MSRRVRASDDRARRMVTRTTRRDKLGEEKREMREEERDEAEEVKADLGLMDECVICRPERQRTPAVCLTNGLSARHSILRKQ